MNNFNLFTRSLLCCVLMLFVGACKKSDGPDHNEYLVKEIHLDNILKNTYEYNNTWQLTASTYKFERGPNEWITQTSSYAYDNAGRLWQTELTHSKNTLWPITDYRLEYTYNSQGQLLFVEAYELNTNKFMYSDEYSYNGQTIVNTHAANNGPVWIATYTLDDSGNIVKRVVVSAGTTDPTFVEQWLNYDDKKNVDGPAAGSISSKNNPRLHLTQLQGSTGFDTTALTYSYNKAGYVTNCTTPNGSGVLNKKYVLIPKK